MKSIFGRVQFSYVDRRLSHLCFSHCNSFHTPAAKEDSRCVFAFANVCLETHTIMGKTSLGKVLWWKASRWGKGYTHPPNCTIFPPNHSLLKWLWQMISNWCVKVIWEVCNTTGSDVRIVPKTIELKLSATKICQVKSYLSIAPLVRYSKFKCLFALGKCSEVLQKALALLYKQIEKLLIAAACLEWRA